MCLSPAVSHSTPSRYCVLDNRMNELVRKHYRKHWRLICTQIAALVDGANPKRGFLFDCCGVDERELMSMMAKLRSEKFVRDDILLVLVGLDYFIVNKSKFREPLTQQILVDISGNSPEILESTELIQQKLSEIKNTILSHESADILRIEFNAAYSPPTIFGFLINYPILYHHQRAHEANCLSHINLKVFRVTTCNQLLMSFSVPETLYDQCENVRKSIATHLAYFERTGEHIVETFIANYPDIVL